MKLKRISSHLPAAALIIALFFSSWGCNKSSEYIRDGWTFQVSKEGDALSISHRDLGDVFRNVRIAVKQQDTLLYLRGWNAEIENNKLVIRAQEPAEIIVEFSALENQVQAAASSNLAVLTGLAPAPKNRMPARVADPEKILRSETQAGEDYTGIDTFENYYIPAENPHVMYLALGPVDALNLHALFDKQSDVVIQFPDNSRIARSREESDCMEVTVPLQEETALISLTHEYYTDVLGMPRYVPYDDTYHTTAPTGWNHWLAFFRQVTEQDIVDHADFISKNLKKYGMIHCQLDDGFDHPSHRHWDKDWDPVTFPHGPSWLADYIKSKGLIPGLWTVPYSYCVEHGNPDWFLRDKDGNIAMDYQGGGELDFTKPEVIRDYWRPILESLKSQGWEYYKFDMGSTVQMWHRYHDQFSDPTKSSYDVSRETLKIFREIMGPEIWHTNHPDAWGGRMGIIDVAGCGRDPGPGWRRMNNFMEVISNNTYQNHIIWYSDPDCIVLRGKPTRADAGHRNTEFLTLEEARSCASLLSLAGLQFLSGDDLPNLEEERLELIRKTIPILPIFPIDLFGRGRNPENYQKIMDLKVNAASGVYDVVAATNWNDLPEDRTISLTDELALAPGNSFLVFDYWQEKLLGSFSNEFTVAIPPHGTRAMTVRSLLPRPQLMATNRHITSALSIKNLDWNEEKSELHGTSETIPETMYKLFIHVPDGYSITKVDTNADQLPYNLRADGMLEVQLMGQEEPVEWKIQFNQ